MMILATMALLSGCFKGEAGIIINDDGTGGVYSKNLMLEEFIEDTESSGSEDGFFYFGDESFTEPLRETVGDEVYVGNVTKQVFYNLDEITELTGGLATLTEDAESVTILISPDSTDETPEEMNEEELAMMKDIVDAKFKITLPGQILETNGEVVVGNSVVWDLLENGQEPISVKYKKTPGLTLLKPVLQPQTDTIKVTIDGKLVDFVDQDPVIVNERTLVPVRMISEELDFDVDWDAQTKTVSIYGNEKSIFITIGDSIVEVYSEDWVGNIELDVPAQVINNRTMVPLRAISEILDIQVDWDGQTKTAILTR